MLYRIALPVYWLVLASATHMPGHFIPTQITYRDKVIHLVAFAGLAFFYWRFLEALGKRPRVWSAALVLLGYAAIDEYTQQFVHRTTDIWDYTANALGISFAIAALSAARHVKAKVTSSSQTRS